MAKRPRRFGRHAWVPALYIALATVSAAQAQDEDGDGLGDTFERAFGDTDRDRHPDHRDRDDDDDGVDTSQELGPNLEQLLDTDADGKPDYRDPDDDGDGAATRDERSSDPGADTNQNGVPAYLDAMEVGPHVADADGDGLLDAEDPDDDNDEVADLVEQSGDSDGDGKPDRVDADDDGDYLPTRVETPTTGAGSDRDGDGSPNYLDTDDDGDGLRTEDEDPDPNGDGLIDDARSTSMAIPDFLNADDDGDDIPTQDERSERLDLDTDADGTPDRLDADDDGDSQATGYEGRTDSDHDGVADYLDVDDDGDGIETRAECADASALDFDDDGVLNYLDLDADADGTLDAVEGVLDRDADGFPDYLDGEPVAGDAGAANPDDAGLLDAGGDGGDDAAIGDAGAPRADAGGPTVTVRPVSHDEGCAVHVGHMESGPSFPSCILLALITLLRRRMSRALLATCAASLDGCADEQPSPAPLDASLDATWGDRELGDATDELEAGADADGPALGDGGFASECSGDELRFTAIRSEGRTFAAAIDLNRIHLAYLVAACGDTNDVAGARDVHHVEFATAGSAGEPHEAVAGGCAPRRDPVLRATSDRQVTLYYGAAGGAFFELYACSVSGTCEPAAETSSPEREQLLAGTAFAGGELTTLAYVVEGPRTKARAVLSIQRGRAPFELLSPDAGHYPTGIALSPVEASGGTARGVIGWVNDLGPASGVYVRLVAQTGQSLGEPLALTHELGSLSRVALASRPSSTAVVYTESFADDVHELRFRALSAEGVLGDEVRITSGNERVGEFAVTASRSGYAIAYRRLSSELNGRPAVRLLFVDEHGNVGGSRFVAAAAAGGSALSVLEANDGRLVVIWDDLEPLQTAGASASMTVRAARLTCP